MNEYDNEYDDNESQDGIEKESVKIVRQLSLKYFQRKLVKHFSIMFHHNQLRWTIR
jgi:hypothetical protein